MCKIDRNRVKFVKIVESTRLPRFVQCSRGYITWRGHHAHHFPLPNYRMTSLSTSLYISLCLYVSLCLSFFSLSVSVCGMSIKFARKPSTCSLIRQDRRDAVDTSRRTQLAGRRPDDTALQCRADGRRNYLIFRWEQFSKLIYDHCANSPKPTARGCQDDMLSFKRPPGNMWCKWLRCDVTVQEKKISHR